MRKFMLALLIVTVAMAFMVPVAFAEEAGESDIVHLWMYPDPNDECDDCYGDSEVDPDAWGLIKFKYFEVEDDKVLEKFVFNGKNLTPGEEYTLYSGGEKIGGAYANNGGNVHIMGTYEGSTGDYINLWQGESPDDVRVLRAMMP